MNTETDDEVKFFQVRRRSIFEERIHAGHFDLLRGTEQIQVLETGDGHVRGQFRFAFQCHVDELLFDRARCSLVRRCGRSAVVGDGRQGAVGRRDRRLIVD